ncbi:hypothetical protein K439DRAFT_1365397, partial [Ramaria rubella]
LRRWLGRSDCPPAIKECKLLFDKAYAPQHDEYPSSNFDQNFLSSSKPVPVPCDLQHLVKQPKIIFHAWLPFGRIVYARYSTHCGNSLVFFYPSGDKTTQPVPGCIQYIIEIDSHISLAVQRHYPMKSGTIDPYRHFPHFPASLYSVALSPTIGFVEVDWVLCHFARWLFSPDHVVVLLLSMVSCTDTTKNSQNYIFFRIN